MELARLLLEQIMSMAMMCGAGFLVAKLKILGEEDSRMISRVCIYVVTPCALVNGFQTDFDPAKVTGMAMAALAACFTCFGSVGLSKLLSYSPLKLTVGERGSISYSNAGNLVMPLVSQTLGVGYLIYTCAYQLIQNTLFWTHGKSLMSGQRSFSLKNALLNINMCSIYLGLALFLLRIRLPGPVGSTVATLGGMLGPLSMLVIGIMLSRVDLRAVFTSARIYMLCALRLLVFPALQILVLVGLFRLWGGSDAANVLTVVLLCASAPSATLITQMAQLYGSPEKEHISTVNAATTVLCVFTMPLMCMMFRMLTGN